MTEYEWTVCPQCGAEFGGGAACAVCGTPRHADVPADSAGPKAAPDIRRSVGGRPPRRDGGERDKQGRIRDGVLLLLLLHSLQLVWLGEPLMMWFTGITQLAYVLPASIVLMVMGRWSTLGGLWLAAVGTAVLNFLLAGLICGGGTGIGG